MLDARRNKAQSTLEYVVVIVAIVGVILVAASGILKPGVQKSMDYAQDILGDAAGKLNTAIPAKAGAPGGGTGGTPGVGTTGTASPIIREIPEAPKPS